MACSMSGFPVLHHLPELAQTHVHWVTDVIESSCPLSSSSPPAFNLSQYKYSVALPFFGIWMKTDLFLSCGHCWVFQICWHIECSTWQHRLLGLQQCSWNSITSPSLFTAMLPKAHLTLHSRMALDERSHHYDYLGHEDLFVQFFCVFLSPLLNIFCFC